MDWKTTARHAGLLVIVGIVLGFIEAGIDVGEPKQLLALFLVGQFALLCAYTAIFARLAFRTARRPWVAAIVAAALSESVALGLLAALQVDAPAAPLVLVIIEWLVVTAALVAGTTLGMRRRSSRCLEAQAT